MSPYAPLPKGSVRLLLLLPHRDENSRIRCQLIPFSLLDRGSSHPYEALSYVWGSQDNKRPIYLSDNNELRVTANLHAALKHLRHCSMARTLWIDAICINQADDDEKGQQIQIMAQIYAKSSRVIVWLVDASGDGCQASSEDEALEAIRAAAAGEQRVDSPKDEQGQQAILALLERKWFQRIWVLQEIAAARHILIKSGPTEIDGYAFCEGLAVLKPFEHRPDLQALIPPIVYLIKGSIFRRRQDTDDTSLAGRFSLNIRPLAELVDMYHTRQATFALDKVYALLGMSSDDLGIKVDYGSSWKNLVRELFNPSNAVSVSTWDTNEVAVIEAKGYVLGKVSSVQNEVEITWKATRDTDVEPKSWFTFQASAKAIKEDDVVCLLHGASRAMVIRPCGGFSTIIRIAGPTSDRLPNWLPSTTTSAIDLQLVWDWDKSQKGSQADESYEYFVSRRKVFHCPTTGCRCQHHLDKAARLLDVGMVLDGVKRYEEAAESFERAMGVYETVAALRNVDNTSPGHGPYRDVDKKILGLMTNPGTDVEVKYYTENRWTLLHLAAINGHENGTKLLIKAGAEKETRDRYQRTPLRLAAEYGHDAVTRLLIKAGAEKETRDQHQRTPLHLAAEYGHDAVTRLLIKAGAEKETRDQYQRTPLHLAAEYGHDAVARLLIEAGAGVDAIGARSRKPLHLAAVNGHYAVARLLIEAGAEK
ncbi:hypothetical protein RB595_005419 [Gaeumannomyces hyphopodioides]